MPKPFNITLVGTFHSFTLYNHKGEEIFDLEEAIEFAEDYYNGNWDEIFNGEEATSREEWLEWETH